MRMKHPVAKHRTNEPRTATVLSLFARKESSTLSTNAL
jgi:hypothetical protein